MVLTTICKPIYDQYVIDEYSRAVILTNMLLIFLKKIRNYLQALETTECSPVD